MLQIGEISQSLLKLACSSEKKLRRWRSHALGGAKISFPHECDSHTVTEGVRYTPFRIPHRRGTAVASPTTTSASVNDYQCFRRRLPVLPSTITSASVDDYQCFRLRVPVHHSGSVYEYQCTAVAFLRLSVLPSVLLSTLPQWLPYDYQCFPLRISVFLSTI